MKSSKQRKYELFVSPLYGLSSRKHLAQLLGMSNGELRKLAREGISYSEWEIDKKKGGKRHIENPCEKLKRVQKRVAVLLSRINTPDFLFCPVKGRSYLDNAARHIGNRVVRCLDVQEYFKSTSSRRVFWFFNSVMKCPSDIAGLLTRLATHNGHLPTGSPLSPILAFYANFDTWCTVAEFCEKNEITLTVYIDDITLSSGRLADETMWSIKTIIHRGGLSCHKEKKYVDKSPEVTGIVLRDGVLHVPLRQHKKQYELRRRLRASSLAHASPTFVRRLEAIAVGLSGQFRQVDRANQEPRSQSS